MVVSVGGAIHLVVSSIAMSRFWLGKISFFSFDDVSSELASRKDDS
jgi:hypothetical protein